MEDHCKAIDLIIHNGRVGEVYNIGGHNEMRNIDIVKIICKALGKPESLITFVADRKGHDMRYAIDPTKTTKTTEKYRLLSGTLTLKKGGTKATPDDAKLVPWLKANGFGDYVKTEESAKWGELKKGLTFVGSVATITETGEIVEGITVTEQPDIFKVDL